MLNGLQSPQPSIYHLGCKLIKSRLASRISLLLLGWQYAFFMEMVEVKSTQGEILAALERLGRRTDPESSSLFVSKCHSLEEFDVFEKKLATEVEFNILVSVVNNKVVFSI